MNKPIDTITDVSTLQALLSCQQQTNQQLQQALANQRESAQQQQETIAELKLMVDKLQQQVEQLLRQLYGKKTERRANTKTPDESAAESSPSKSTSTPSTGGGRQTLPKHLPRERREHTLTEQERVCPSCGEVRQRISETTREQLEFIPAKLIVIEHARQTYACSACSGHLITAPCPDYPLAKGLAGPGLLAEVLVSKYLDALPLYRQERRWARLGVDLSRKTLCDWVAGCAQLCKPLVECQQRLMLATSPKLHTDDTPLPVLVSGKGRTHTGRLWVYLGGSLGALSVIYQYSSSRRGEVPQAFLANYQGYLQADAYPGYDKLYAEKPIIEVGCLAHARRKFYDITQAVKEPSLADEAIEFIGQLYGVETHIKHWPPPHKRAYRRKYAKPIWKRYRRWCQKHTHDTLPQSPIHQAIAYTLNHWIALTRYLSDGILAIDNNAAERLIKLVILGRKNYLFAGSHQGAEHAAIIYSLIATCQLNDVNPYDYFKDVLARLPTQKMTELEALLPYNWQPREALL